MRRITIFALLAGCVPWATAQSVTGAAGTHFPNSCNLGNVNATSSRVPGFHRFSAPQPALFLPFALFPDSVYTGFSNPPPPPRPEVSLDLKQVLTALTRTQPEESLPPAQPLLIELRGNRYVQVKGDDTPADSRLENVAVKPAPRSAGVHSARSNPRQSTAPDISPATLVFRDGHTEQVRDYAIAGGVMYARGNFYADGYWNKQIELSTLDIAQTTQWNASHGVRFVLPAGPNEVITRP